jgi:hypothetical protein
MKKQIPLKEKENLAKHRKRWPAAACWLRSGGETWLKAENGVKK